MLNKCKCGAVAKQHSIGSKLFIVCVSSDCSRVSEGDDWGEVRSEWNSQNPSTDLSPDDFEKMFFRSLIWMDLASINDPNQFLAEFETHFGFDLKEVVREQWGKEHRYYD